MPCPMAIDDKCVSASIMFEEINSFAVFVPYIPLLCSIQHKWAEFSFWLYLPLLLPYAVIVDINFWNNSLAYYHHSTNVAHICGSYRCSYGPQNKSFPHMLSGLKYLVRVRHWTLYLNPLSNVFSLMEVQEDSYIWSSLNFFFAYAKCV